VDDVYSCAEITIIAAAGGGENTGLLGVGANLGKLHPTAQVGSMNVIPTLPDQHNTIVASKWWTRAWTYGEAVLSRRRLVFTEEQVYFECNVMNCCESLLVNMDATLTPADSSWLRVSQPDIFSARDMVSEAKPSQQAAIYGVHTAR
jgi:hypothetical protein